mmetsp:Transcript_519/g.774  ORF Transcript_519/g.774 Transcript_519/m.774 type:complete len:82 (+) Transcript_519:1353-1598(+)
MNIDFFTFSTAFGSLSFKALRVACRFGVIRPFSPMIFSKLYDRIVGQQFTYACPHTERERERESYWKPTQEKKIQKRKRNR